MNQDKAQGTANETIGKVKTAAGELTDSQSLKNEGSADKVVGAVQKTIGKVKDAVEELKK